MNRKAFERHLRAHDCFLHHHGGGERPGSAYERLLSVCRLMALEAWAEMVGAPMGSEFLEACERIDPEI